jgi:ferritin
MVNPITLSDVVVNTLNARIGDEYTAHYFYNSAYNWCLDKNYQNAAAFFAAESMTELAHAQKIQKYLVDWNCAPILPQVETNFKFSTLADIVEKSYQLELDLFNKYIKDSQAIFAIDLSTFDFLQGFRQKQSDSVVEYSDLLAALELININNKLDVLHFEEMYFKA